MNTYPETLSHSLLAEQSESFQEIDWSLLTQTMESVLFKGGKLELEALESLVQKLRENITTYDSIISDEASGRIPSLILWKLINRKRKSVGKRSIPIYFISGRLRGSEDRQKLVEIFLHKKKKSLGTKTLLSTEYVLSGDGVEQFVNILNRLKIPYDISSVIVHGEYLTRNPPKSPFIIPHLIFGADTVLLPKFYKDTSKGVSTCPYNDIKIHPSVRRCALVRKEVILARRDINRIVDELYKLL